MPRPKRTFLSSDFVLLKTPCNDIFYDYFQMLEFQYNRFKKYLHDPEIYKLTKKIEIAKNLSSKPKHASRVYLLYNVSCTALVLYDLDESVVRHFNHAFYLVGSLDFDEIHPADAFTLFIFDGTKLSSVYDIGIQHLVELTYAFSTENQLSKSAIRDAWYAEPRRRAKSQQRPLHS